MTTTATNNNNKSQRWPKEQAKQRKNYGNKEGLN